MRRRRYITHRTPAMPYVLEMRGGMKENPRSLTQDPNKDLEKAGQKLFGRACCLPSSAAGEAGTHDV